jgi:hypothetical protein
MHGISQFWSENKNILLGILKQILEKRVAEKVGNGLIWLSKEAQ